MCPAIISQPFSSNRSSSSRWTRLLAAKRVSCLLVPASGLQGTAVPALQHTWMCTHTHMPQCSCCIPARQHTSISAHAMQLTLGLPPLSVSMVTLLTVPQLEKCICSSSGVQP
jgi:hypothetical protein